jgi:ribosomal-protein-alanine N-acetyltransferase
MATFEPITIPTERLTLRFMTEADIPAIYQIYSHPEVMRYWSTPAWTEFAQAQQLLKDAREGYLTGNALQLGIERNSDRAFMGMCNLFHFHVPSRRAELGYILGRSYWGSGYMHDALLAFVEHAFQILNLNRLEADIDPRNLPSARTLERLGFHKDGELRERWIVNDEISDTWLYGLLRREWLAGRKLF